MTTTHPDLKAGSAQPIRSPPYILATQKTCVST